MTKEALQLAPEIEVWKEWKKDNDPDKLGVLLHKYDGMIQSAVNKYDNPNMPRTALEGEAKNQAFTAFQTYNPKFGTKLSTHVGTRLKKLYSYVSKFQNVGKIPEGEISNINTFKLAKEDLRTKFKREPSTHEVADHLSWSPNRVSRMESSLRKDYIASEDIHAFETNPKYEKMMFAYYDLTPEQQIVFDYVLGAHGKQRLAPGEIADKLGVSPSKISSIKNDIAKVLEPFMY